MLERWPTRFGAGAPWVEIGKEAEGLSSMLDR